MRRPSYNDSLAETSTKSVGMKKRFRVCFEESSKGQVKTESHNAQHPLDVTQWYTKDEWADIRHSGQVVIDSVTAGDVIWSQARRRSYVKTMTRVYRVCAKDRPLSEAMKEELIFWTCIGHSRRGLENYTLPEVQQERSRRRRQHREGIFFVQDQCWDADMGMDQTARLLKAASEKLSRATKQFATTLAEADSHAVENDVEEELAQALVNKLSAQFDAERSRTPSPPTRQPESKPFTNAAA